MSVQIETNTAFASAKTQWHFASFNQSMIALVTPMLAAAGYALIYLLLGGGLGGAILIFLFAKMLGK